MMFSRDPDAIDIDQEAAMSRQIAFMEQEANNTIKYTLMSCGLLYLSPFVVDFAFKFIPV